MRNWFLLFITCLFFLASSCGLEKKESLSIFLDYQVSGDEHLGTVTSIFQYRMGGPLGRIIVMDTPAKVVFDGRELEQERVDLTGAYYESVMPLDGFEGKHTVVFTDWENRRYETDFQFVRMRLLEEIPDKMETKPFSIRLTGLGKEPAFVRLVMINGDTGNDINSRYELTGGELRIDEEILAQIGAGSIILQIFREEEQPISTGDDVKGKIRARYSLQREFEIVNSQ